MLSQALSRSFAAASRLPQNAQAAVGASTTAALLPPIELSFQDSYGALVRHAWLGGGFVAAGFRSGQVVVLSTRG